MRTARLVRVVMILMCLTPAAAGAGQADYVGSSYVDPVYVDPVYVNPVYALPNNYAATQGATPLAPAGTRPEGLASSTVPGASTSDGVALPGLPTPAPKDGSPITRWDAIGLAAMAVGAIAALVVRRRLRRVVS